MTRRLGAIAFLGLAVALSACGGEESDLLTEGEVRQCLADAGIADRPPAATEAASPEYVPLYLETAPDFTAYTKDGAAIDVVVQSGPERARRTAAHVKGTLESLGGSFSSGSERVVQSENVVAVFRRAASPADRNAVRSCLAV